MFNNRFVGGIGENMQQYKPLGVTTPIRVRRRCTQDSLSPKSSYGFEWAKQPISMLTTFRYSFTQFLNAFQGGLQLNEELARANALEMNYDQYLNNPHDVRYPHNSKSNPKNGYSTRKGNSRSPYGYRTQSPARLGSRTRSPNPYDPSRTND